MSSAASSSAPPPLPDVDMTPATSTASASPHTLPGQCSSTQRCSHLPYLDDRRPVISDCPQCRVVAHALTLPSPLLCDVAILYVQVEGDVGSGPVGDVAPLPNDSIRSVMQQAVEQELIDPIRWRDVAEWQLWGSPEKVQRLHSGTRSKRLSELLPFPDESLLVLTRRPIPPTISSSSSSSSASSLSSSSSSLPSSTSYSQPVLSPSRTAPVSCGV